MLLNEYKSQSKWSIGNGKKFDERKSWTNQMLDEECIGLRMVPYIQASKWFSMITIVTQ